MDALKLMARAWAVYDNESQLSANPGLRGLIKLYIMDPSDGHLDAVRDAIAALPGNELGRVRRVARELARWPNGMPEDV